MNPMFTSMSGVRAFAFAPILSLLALAACGSEGTSPSPTDTSSEGEPQQSDALALKMKKKPCACVCSPATNTWSCSPKKCSKNGKDCSGELQAPTFEEAFPD